MLSGLMTTEDEEEIMKELDELREQEVTHPMIQKKITDLIREYRMNVVNLLFFPLLIF